MKTEGTYAIKEECMKQFLSKETFFTLLRPVATVLILFGGATISYGIANAVSVAKQEQKILIIENKQQRLDSEINSKLDSLLKKP